MKKTAFVFSAFALLISFSLGFTHIRTQNFQTSVIGKSVTDVDYYHGRVDSSKGLEFRKNNKYWQAGIDYVLQALRKLFGCCTLLIANAN